MGDAKRRLGAGTRNYVVGLSERDRFYLMQIWNSQGQTKNHIDRRALGRFFDAVDMDTLEISLRPGRGIATFSDDDIDYQLPGDVLDYAIEVLDKPIEAGGAYFHRMAARLREYFIEIKNAPAPETTDDPPATNGQQVDDKPPPTEQLT